ncbi:MAG TPA: aldolase/citrate lyase family protein [Syntrophales bacterium]|nr:aldolase/citrate lyase family protein [Syntrophales bacterium]HOI15444.1 aldolase/citrate lyase family protein [Geobacteraceae bacterium]
MEKKQAFAGNRGPKVKNDCYISLELAKSGGIQLQLDSKVGVYYGGSIEKLCKEVLVHLGVRHASVTIEDVGAYDFVIAARLEACVRQVKKVEKAYVPAFIPENRYSSSAERMRFSRLYIPGNTPGMMINAGIYGAHGIILDLEDAVAPAKKDEARLLVRNALRQVNFYGAERMVRINQLPRGLDDLEEIIPHNVHVVLLPKCESREQVQEVNKKIASIRKGKKLKGDVYLMPIIESALGVIRAYEIASSAENVVAVAIGLEDYCADLGVQRTKEGFESQYAKSYLANACRAAGVQAIDSVFSDFQDEEGLRKTVLKSKSMGFEGIGCIHPNQIKPIHESFAPQEEEITKAKAIVRVFEKAKESGLGVVALGSKMIDAPVVKRAVQSIDRAIALGKLSKDWRTQDE